MEGRIFILHGAQRRLAPALIGMMMLTNSVPCVHICHKFCFMLFCVTATEMWFPRRMMRIGSKDEMKNNEVLVKAGTQKP